MRAIDLFAGAGGFSEGARMAGLEVVWAANHWPEAVRVHSDNHPGTAHACQDLHQTDWTTVPAFDVLLASPACQGHSRARGKDRPHHDAARATAWAVVSAAECHQPRTVVVENVPEFAAWVLFPAWVSALEALGYTIRAEVLDASRFGVPQLRRRLFIVATRGRAFDFAGLHLQDPVPVASILDLGAGNWRPTEDQARKSTGLRPLVPATRARILAGRKRHAGLPFWFPYFGSNVNGWGLDGPIWTITTRDRYALVKGNQMRLLTVDECRRAMGFPSSYRLPANRKTAIHLLGNAVCPPVAAELLRRCA